MGAIAAPAYASPLEWAEAVRPPVMHPALGPVPYIPRDYQAEVLGSWREQCRLIVKSRQIGITQTLALEAYWKTRHAGRPLVLCVSRNEDQAKQFIRYAREAAVHEGTRLVRDNELELEFERGVRIKAQAATKSAGRGFPASDVYLDELAFAQWATDIYQSISPTVSTGGTMTVYSSPKGRANLLFLLWTGRFGDEDWWRKSYSWRVLWDEEWAERKRRTMTREGFAEEYEAADGFLETGGTVFRQSDIDACRRETAAEPVEGRSYLLSVDPAGWGDDATVLQVWDVTAKPYTLARQERWTVGPFERAYGMAANLVTRYGCHAAHIDQTGLGAPMAEEFTNRLKPLGCKVEGFTFTPKSKAEAITALTLLLEQREMAFDDAQLATELEIYQIPDTDIVTDCVMAAAIMAHATRSGHRTEWW